MNTDEYSIADFLLESIKPSLGVIDPSRIAVIVSNSKYNFSAFGCPEKFANKFMAHNISSYIASKIGNGCLPYNVVAACATGLVSIIKGIELLNRKIVDVVVAGSIETSKTDLIEAAFSKMGVLSHIGRTLPFANNRDGFVIGEGGAVIVMKRADEMIDDNAPKITGYAYGNDASDIVAINSDAKSIKRLISQSLNMAGLKHVDYINAHGTGTTLNDQTELKGICAAFEDTSSIYLNSTKYYTGHLLGATGSVELVLSLMAMKNKEQIPNNYLQDPMPDMIKFSNQSVTEISSILTLNYGFGGHIAALVVNK
ncbi:MAG: hypothetical protein A2Y40_08900 [Candidatus Margulisbacteria bacterium GWF2_35_9]|nr:MAG: hypothetical protein A2Y40_08900 [Candidatus Margulisbacteria bacterium GWF2_35_9]